MRYFVRKRARFEGIFARVNLPYGTIVTEAGGVLYQNGKALCHADSHNGRAYFVWAEDGCGEGRAALINRIETKLGKDATLWEQVWMSEVCRKYRDTAVEDQWLWARAFFDAPIADLRQIVALLE